MTTETRRPRSPRQIRKTQRRERKVLVDAILQEGAARAAKAAAELAAALAVERAHLSEGELQDWRRDMEERLRKVQLESKKIPKFKALEMMLHRPGCYDPAILAAVCTCFGVEPTQGGQNGGLFRAVGWRELRAGQTFLSDVSTCDGVLIVTGGVRISAILLERLKNFAQLGGLKEPIQIEDVQEVGAGRSLTLTPRID
jgi:hypothetical protein